MKPTISFLLGSGFSVPENLPSVRTLNERLKKINESEICIHTSLQAFFLNGQNDPNRIFNWDSRNFLQEFLEYYNSEILTEGEEFHYETFYDFYSGYLHSRENKIEIERFWNSFNEKYFKHEEHPRDCLNRISDFNKSFSQLLGELLHRPQYFQDVGYSDYPPYDDFVQLLLKLIEKNDVKVHTLNHDLFFDWLGHHRTKLFEYFCDGFELAGSPYYGSVGFDFNKGTNKEIHKNYNVKLEYFTDKYDKPICFFKLHGSIFNKILYTPYPLQKAVRIKTNYAVSQYYMEVFDDKKNEYKFENLLDRVDPDFLSGTTNKARSYTGDPYYASLFKHFEKNISSSELLFVIGYGFQDPGINDYVEQYFLKRGKKMIVIDPSNSCKDLLSKYKGIHIAKILEEVSIAEYLKEVPNSMI